MEFYRGDSKRQSRELMDVSNANQANPSPVKTLLENSVIKAVTHTTKKSRYFFFFLNRANIIFLKVLPLGKRV